MVILHIKLKGMKHRTTCKQIVCPLHTHTLDPGVGKKGHFFLKVVKLHTQLKGMKHASKKCSYKEWDQKFIFF